MLARRTIQASANADSNSNGVNASDSTTSNDNHDNQDSNVITHTTSNNTESVHILVLETDEPHPETQDRKGSFGQIFHDLFVEAGSEHDPPLTVTTSMHYIVDDPENDKNGHVPTASEIPESIHAILITGSMYDAHGDDRWVTQLLDLLKDLWMNRPDLLFSGVCFGHQILARLLGASVDPTPGGRWELAHTEMDLTAIGQKLFRTDDKKLALHQMHQDQVSSVPDPRSTPLLEEGTNVHVWASTEHTKIQGLYIKDRLFSTQGHLGFDEKMVRRQIEMREESGGIEDDEHAAEGKEKAHMKHDGVVVAGAILRFFHGEDHDVD